MTGWASTTSRRRPMVWPPRTSPSRRWRPTRDTRQPRSRSLFHKTILLAHFHEARTFLQFLNLWNDLAYQNDSDKSDWFVEHRMTSPSSSWKGQLPTELASDRPVCLTRWFIWIISWLLELKRYILVWLYHNDPFFENPYWSERYSIETIIDWIC